MSILAWTYIFVGLSFGLYLFIAWRVRVRDTQGFYVAGRGVPAAANGMATAADWMSAASFISMAGLISTMGYAGGVYLMGWTGGFVLLALCLAPYLRKFGHFTVPDFVGDRYESQVARLVAVVCAVFVSFTYVAGQMRGVGVVFSRFLEVDINTGVVIGMAIVFIYATLGGMKGITWTQVAQYWVLITAFLVPTIAISIQLTGNFLKSVRAARWSAFWALLFIGGLYLTAPALAAFARYYTVTTLNGANEQQLPGWFKSWEQTGLILWLDDGDGLVRYDNSAASEIYRSGKLSPTAMADIRVEHQKWVDTAGVRGADGRAVLHEAGLAGPDRDIIVLAAPEMAGLSNWIIAFVAAGGLAAALSTASGLLLVISSSVAHDLYYRVLRPEATEKQRLLVGRGVIGLAVVIAGIFGINPPGFVGQVVAFAFGLAASSFFPAIFLGIFSRRVGSVPAITGMVAGIGFTASYIIGVVFFGMQRWTLGFVENGVTPEAIGSVGMLLNFAVTLALTPLFPPPSERTVELINSVREPEGAGAAVVIETAVEH